MERRIRWAWHVHHDVLAERLTEPIDSRIAYIKKHKPKNEQKLRLRLLKQVKGLLPPMWQKADAEWEKADAEWDKADAERDKAYAEWDKADAEWEKAYAERDKAYVAALPKIEALHKQECPN